MSITPEFLHENGHTPQLHPIALSATISLSQYKELEEKGVENVGKFVVLDKSLWAACDRPLEDGNIPDGAGIYSSDGYQVGKDIRRKKFSVFNVGKEGLEPFDYYHLTNIQKPNEERSRMSEQDQLAQLRKIAEGGAAAGGVADMSQLAGQMGEGSTNPMASFDNKEGAGDGEQTVSKKDEKLLIRKEITSHIQNVKTADYYALQMFNRVHGHLTAYVTATDAKVDFSTTSSVIMGENGRPILKQDVTESVRDAYNRGESVAKPNYVQEKVLHIRQSKPGKMLGAVIAIPEGGLVKIAAFREVGKEVEYDKEAKDLVYKLYNRQMMETMIQLYFGNEIQEDPKTHGGPAAGKVKLKNSAVIKPKEGRPTGLQVVNLRPYNENRKSLLIGTNYVPVKTYKTIALKGNLSEEEIKTLNLSAFIGFVQPRTVKGQTTQKINDLSPKDREKIIVGENNEISSKYFNNNPDRLHIEVRPFWDPQNGQFISPVEIPVKEGKPTKANASVLNYRYVTYSAVDENVLSDPAKAALTSLQNPRFKTAVEASGGALTVESLRKLVQRNVGPKESHELTNDEMIKLTLSIGEGTLSSDVVQVSDLGQNEFQQFSRAITDMVVGAGK